jgi:integrase
LVFEELRSMAQKPKEPLRQDLVVTFDLGDLGRVSVDYDANKPEEVAEADRQIERLAQRVGGKGKEVDPPRQITTETGKEPLQMLVDDFLSDSEVNRRRDKAATVRKDRDALRLFVRTIGAGVAPSSLSQSHAVAFADALATTGLAANTMNNHMGAVSKFSRWIRGRRPRYAHTALDFSALRFRLEKRPDEQREAFTIEEVRRILQDTRTLEFKETAPHKFWMPYIAAYSGMRAEEIAQLDPTEDFVQIEGILAFDINDRGGKQLKNAASRRLVPVHPVLLSHGLHEYVARTGAQGHRRLFPHTGERDGRLAKNAAKTVNRLIQKNLGIPKSLHSFRHTVATLLKQERVDESVAAAVLGHAHGGITYSRYGKSHLVQVLLTEAVAKIRYGLEAEAA